MRQKELLKRLAPIALGVMLAVGGVSPSAALAAEPEQTDKTVVVMSSDKTAYTDGDTIVSSVRITNGNAGKITGISVAGQAPAGYVVAENPTEPAEIEAGESADYSIEFLDSDIIPTYAVNQQVSVADRYVSKDKITKYAIVDKNEKKLATVSKKGVVTCKKEGEITVTAYTTVKNGKKKTYEPVGTYTLKIEKPQVVKKTLSLKADETYSLNGNDYITAQKAKITSWHTSKRKVATVDANTGAITVHKKGTAKITAYFGEGKKAAKYSFTLKVTKAYINYQKTINADTFDTAFDNSANISVIVNIDGVDTEFAALVSYKVEDPVPEEQTVFTVSFDTLGGSAVASVEVAKNEKINESSIPDPTKAGFYFENWCTDAECTDDYDFDKAVTQDFTLYANWSSENERIVSSPDKLSAVLSAGANDTRSVVYKTKGSAAVNIADASYPNTELLINAPNTHFENSAIFKKVNLQAVSSNTYVEGAAQQNIEILKDSKINLRTKGSVRQDIKLHNKGLFSLTIANPVDFVISGDAIYERNTIGVEAAAAGSSLRTSQNIDLDAESKIELIIEPTANNNIVTVANEAAIPDIKGIGSVQVNNRETGAVETIPANYYEFDDAVDTGRPLTVNGRIDPENATVYLVRYINDLDIGNIDSVIRTASASVVAAEGQYSFADVDAGYYYLVAEAEGYVTEFKGLYVPAVSADPLPTVDAGKIGMVSSEIANGDKVHVYGYVTDVQDYGDESGINYAVRLRVFRGIDVSNGTPIIDKLSETDGTYDLGELSAGNYTLQVTAADNEVHPVVAATERLYVRPGMVSEGSSGYEISVKSGNADRGEVSYILWWNHAGYNVPSDLDSHLVGPAALAEDKKLHTWYSDRIDWGYGSGYYDEDGEEDSYYDYSSARTIYAELDRDDVTYHGPETTTIYKRTDGVYNFYVLNFSNHSDLSDTRMTEYSDAYVQVFVNGNQIATFDIPTGVGPLWYVCDFDSVTGILTPVNKILPGYGDGGETVGMMTDAEANEYFREAARNQLYSVIQKAERYVSEANESGDITAVQAQIDAARAVWGDESKSKDEINEAEHTLNNVIYEVLPNISKIQYSDESFAYFDIYSYYYDDGELGDYWEVIEIYNDERLSDDIIIEMVGENQKWELLTDENAESGQVIRITNNLNGIVRNLVVRYAYDE